MAEPTSAAFRGALDLSSLVKPANTAATPAAPTAPMANPVADSKPGDGCHPGQAGQLR
jgi:hypothetical protein